VLPGRLADGFADHLGDGHREVARMMPAARWPSTNGVDGVQHGDAHHRGCRGAVDDGIGDPAGDQVRAWASMTRATTSRSTRRRFRRLDERLELDLAAARRRPEETRALMTTIEQAVRAKLDDLYAALAADRTAADVFRELFPEGLVFQPARAENERRQVWNIEG
jgi:hypothetical protein